jgi:transcriptional regulator with XRE-family HTH domain
MPFHTAPVPSNMRRRMPTEAKQQKAREIGERIKRCRERIGWTQDQLARHTDNPSITGNAISRWERGQVMARTTSLEHLAAAMGVEAGYLIFGSGASRAAGATSDEVLGLIEQRLTSIDAHLERLADVFTAGGREPRIAELVRQALARLDEALPRTEGAAPPRATPARRAPRKRRAAG